MITVKRLFNLNDSFRSGTDNNNIVIPALDTELDWLNKVCEAGITCYHSNFTIVNEW